MNSRELLSGNVQVDYQQFYVAPAGEFVDFDEAFRGQSNGICGAAQSGRLWLTTGLHVGVVNLKMALHASEPPIDPRWEEVVECSFVNLTDRLAMLEWGTEDGRELDIPRGTYRVRYSAECMLHDGQLTEANTPTQRYALDFWLAPAQPDTIVKATGECAKSWHAQMGRGHEA